MWTRKNPNQQQIAQRVQEAREHYVRVYLPRQRAL